MCQYDNYITERDAWGNTEVLSPVEWALMPMLKVGEEILL